MLKLQKHRHTVMLSLAVLILAPVLAAINARAADELPGLLKARQAGLAQSKGRLPEAVALYTEALKDRQLTNDRKGVILADRGVIHARLGQTKQAIVDFNQAVTLFPEYAAAYNNRGSVLLSIGLVNEALKDFDRAIVLAPGYVASYNNRAGALIRMSKPGIAIEDYTTAVKLAPALAEPLGGRARIMIAQQRPYAALRDLNRAIANDSRFAPAYRLRGQVNADLNDYSRAAQDLSRAIAFNPTNVGAYLARGRAYLEARNVEAAVTDFTKVISLRPNSATAYRERGHANVLLDNFEQAEQDLAHSLTLAPKAGLTFAYRALMYKKQGQPELGAQEIQKAMQLTPKNAHVLWAKGEIEEAMANVEGAAASYREALAVDPALRNAEFGLVRLGETAPNQAVYIDELAFGPWRVVRERQRYYAVHEDIQNLRVPLEMASQGQPRILEWEEKGDGAVPIAGLLRFNGGKVETREGALPIEYVALVNLKTRALLDIVPDRVGKTATKWTWKGGRVTIASLDGLASEHILERRAAPAPIAAVSRRGGSRKRRRRARDSIGNPIWAPWADNARPSARRRRSARRRGGRRRKPKTLFDMLLGN